MSWLYSEPQSRSLQKLLKDLLSTIDMNQNCSTLPTEGFLVQLEEVLAMDTLRELSRARSLTRTMKA